ncbi:IS110 family transposase [Streptomyces pseudovenezuelae]|uniref:IS110 family transposase n=1 Tax=Streptomyces pseudovenezuelae TaxID=67350 RepID=UPI002E31D379|nr:IS110 family transposase [Streptomyces pseudovenezuelae]
MTPAARGRNNDGEVLLSRKVINDEPQLLHLISEVPALGEDVVLAVAVADGMASPRVDLRLNHRQTIVYLPGLAVNRASAAYRGLGKTDAKDARVIADQARMRRDLHVLTPESELTAELRVLTDRWADLEKERTRKNNRLHAQVLSIFPALEYPLELTSVGPLVLLSGYQTPSALRRLGRLWLTAWLRNRKTRSAEDPATAAVDAAERQHTGLPGEAAIARVVRDLALESLDLHEKIHELDKLIEARCRAHEPGPVISSLPGIGPTLGAELLAATGGDLSRFPSADRLAAFSGVAHVPRDSGNVNGNLHRPRRQRRGLQRVCYRSAMINIRTCPESRAFYDRKRSRKKTDKHAVLPLARRHVNVLFAMIRDGTFSEPRTPHLA